LIILLFGPPGCGKGTQAHFIEERFHIAAISTGEMLRAECKAGTRLGKLACSILSSGGLVGDEIVNEILAERISRADCRDGFLLDGYPRTIPQACFLDGLLEKRGLARPAVIHLDVPAEALVSRLSARRQCPACSRIYNLLSQPPCQVDVCDTDGAALIRRDDDREEVIRQRLKAYDELTGPVLKHYAGSRCHRVDGMLAPAEVSWRIELLLENMTAAILA
jgi:adenylate kinase